MKILLYLYYFYRKTGLFLHRRAARGPVAAAAVLNVCPLSMRSLSEAELTLLHAVGDALACALLKLLLVLCFGGVSPLAAGNNSDRRRMSRRPK